MGLTESDGTAIASAIRILSEAGYEVEQIGEAETKESAVVFSLQVRSRVRYKRNREQIETVKQAAIDAPDIGMDGNPVEDGDGEDADDGG